MERYELTLNNITSFLNRPDCWYELGIRLGIDKHELDRIELENRGRLQRCMNDMLQFWLDNKDCSWSKLILALNAINLKNVANKLFMDLLTIRFCNQELTVINIAGHLAKVAEKWREIGTSLGVSKATLQKIASNHLEGRKKCLKMLSIWKEEGKKACSWQQIIDALVCGSIYEVVDSAPEKFCQSFEDVPKCTNQKCKSDLIKIKHKLEECESSLRYDMKRIEDWGQKLDMSLRESIGSSLRERWDNMKVATQKLESIPKELESCISLLKYSVNVSKPVSEKLNKCVIELLEFSKQLDPYVSKIRPSGQSIEIAIFLALIIAPIICFPLLGGIYGAFHGSLSSSAKFIIYYMHLYGSWGTIPLHMLPLMWEKIMIIACIGFLLLTTILEGVRYGVSAVCCILVVRSCYTKAVLVAEEVQLEWLPDGAVALLHVILFGYHVGGIYAAIIGTGVFVGIIVVLCVIFPRLRYHLSSYRLLCAIEHTINTCVKESEMAQEKIREVKDTLIDEFIDGYTPI